MATGKLLFPSSIWSDILALTRHVFQINYTYRSKDMHYCYHDFSWFQKQKIQKYDMYTHECISFPCRCAGYVKQPRAQVVTYIIASPMCLVLQRGGRRCFERIHGWLSQVMRNYLVFSFHISMFVPDLLHAYNLGRSRCSWIGVVCHFEICQSLSWWQLGG